MKWACWNLCTDGNWQLMEWVLNYFDNKYGRENLKSQLNILTDKGKSVKDDAMYNAKCRELVHKKGGTNVHPPVKNRLGQKVFPGHPLHRQTRRGWWENQ